MWRMEDIVRTIKFKAAIDAANGEPAMPVPRDRLPASYYRDRNRAVKEKIPDEKDYLVSKYAKP